MAQSKTGWSAAGRVLRWIFKYRYGPSVRGIMGEGRRRIWRWRVSGMQKEFFGSLTRQQRRNWLDARKAHRALNQLWGKRESPLPDKAVYSWDLEQAVQRRQATEKAFVDSLTPAQRAIFDKLNNLYE